MGGGLRKPSERLRSEVAMTPAMGEVPKRYRIAVYQALQEGFGSDTLRREALRLAFGCASYKGLTDAQMWTLYLMCVADGGKPTPFVAAWRDETLEALGQSRLPLETVSTEG